MAAAKHNFDAGKSDLKASLRVRDSLMSRVWTFSWAWIGTISGLIPSLLWKRDVVYPVRRWTSRRKRNQCCQAWRLLRDELGPGLYFRPNVQAGSSPNMLTAKPVKNHTMVCSLTLSRISKQSSSARVREVIRTNESKKAFLPLAVWH